MIMTIETARDVLRVDGSSNDDIITPLLEAIPDYIKTCTGVADPETAAAENGVILTLAKFILQLWYNPDGLDADCLQKVIDNLLKTVKAQYTKNT